MERQYENMNSHVIYQMVRFPMTLSDLGWLSEIIFNDTKHRAVSLRQPSFLISLSSVLRDCAVTAHQLGRMWRLVMRRPLWLQLPASGFYYLRFSQSAATCHLRAGRHVLLHPRRRRLPLIMTDWWWWWWCCWSTTAGRAHRRSRHC